MSTPFELSVELPDEAETDTFDDLLQSQDAFVLSTKLLKLSQSTSFTESPSYVAIFLPSTLVQASLSELATPSSAAADNMLDWRQPVLRVSSSDRQKVSRSLLSMTHPFLAQNLTIKGVVSVKNKLHSPADVVLLDLSHAPAAAVSDLLEATTSQIIHAAEDAVLQVVLISNISVVSNSSSDSTLPQLPTCPVCLFRLDPLRLGLPKIPNHHLCSKFCPPPNLALPDEDESCPRQRLLRPWPLPSRCVCCHTIQKYWSVKPETSELSDLFCCQCAMQETLWVCMTCGFVGCGRYSNKHAAEHFQECRHPFSLELATLRIWDYVEGEFVHRSDLLECPRSPPLYHQWRRQFSGNPLPGDSHSSVEASFSAGAAVAASNVDEKTPKKATMIGEEYEALLQSALEEQAQHYEGEITRLLATLTAAEVDASSMTPDERREINQLHDEISKMRKDIDVSGRELLNAQAQDAGYRATSQRLLREQQITENIVKKIREEIARERNEGRRQIEELEQQIADLTANQRMRDQFSLDEELANAQIFATVGGSPSQSGPKKSGKKPGRRLFRR